MGELVEDLLEASRMTISRVAPPAAPLNRW